MRVAIISSGFLPVIDGVTIAIWHRLQYLNQLDHQVLLFCPDYSTIDFIYPNWQDYTEQILPNVRVVSLPSNPFFNVDFERNVSPKSYQNVLQELEAFQPDIIHIDEPERLWLGFLKRPGVDFARQKEIPCVSFFHTNFIEYIEDYIFLPYPILKIIQLLMKHHRNWIYNSYDAILISSLSTAKKLSKLGFKKVININLLGVDIKKYQTIFRDTIFFEKRYNIVDIDKKIKVVFLGRLTPEKGWKFTLDALLSSGCNIDFRNVAFIIAGDGAMREEIREKLSQTTSNVYALGRISPADVPALLINSDIYITTSEKETRGLTILEAQAAGLPVLAPRAEGIVDSIQDRSNGLLFQPKDQQDFIEKLNSLCSNSTLRQKLGSQAREDTIKYTWEQATKNLLEIWKEQISNYSERILATIRSK